MFEFDCVILMLLCVFYNCMRNLCKIYSCFIGRGFIMMFEDLIFKIGRRCYEDYFVGWGLLVYTM